MRYIQSASAKWSLRPRHHGQMITFVTPPALPVFIDTVGREKTGHGIKGGGRGGAKKTCCGLSDAIAARRYLRPDVLRVTLNYRHLADFKTHCTRAITLKFTICRQRKEGQRSKLFKLNRENSWNHRFWIKRAESPFCRDSRAEGGDSWRQKYSPYDVKMTRLHLNIWRFIHIQR